MYIVGLCLGIVALGVLSYYGLIDEVTDELSDMFE